MNTSNLPASLKAERIQIYFAQLIGWVLNWELNRETGQQEPTSFWTAFELVDHLEACELVAELGKLADKACAAPAIDVRGNIVFVTCGSPKDGLFAEDFEFASAVDLEIGIGQRQQSLLSG